MNRLWNCKWEVIQRHQYKTNTVGNGEDPKSVQRCTSSHTCFFPPLLWVFWLFPFLLSPPYPFCLVFFVFYLLYVCVYVRIYVCAYLATFPPLKRRLVITIRPTCAGQWQNWVSTHLNIKYVPDKKINEIKKWDTYKISCTWVYKTF